MRRASRRFPSSALGCRRQTLDEHVFEVKHRGGISRVRPARPCRGRGPGTPRATSAASRSGTATASTMAAARQAKNSGPAAVQTTTSGRTGAGEAAPAHGPADGQGDVQAAGRRRLDHQPAPEHRRSRRQSSPSSRTRTSARSPSRSRAVARMARASPPPARPARPASSSASDGSPAVRATAAQRARCSPPMPRWLAAR